MAKTLQLTQKELQQLIIETYKELTDKNFVLNTVKNAKYGNWKNLDEQAYIEDDMAYLDPNQSMSDNMSELNRLQKEIDDRVKYAGIKYKKGVNAAKSNDDAWYMDKHLWADIIAAILYIVGALTSAAGVGVILLAAAIIVDLVNAYWYYEEEDYFMAGLQASFILIPGINLAYVKALPGFKQGLKGIASVANKIFSMGGDVSIKQITRKLGKETTEVIAKTLQKNPKILSTAKAGVREIDKFIKAFEKMKKYVVKTNKDWLYDYLIPDWVIASIGGIIKVLKFLKQALILVVAVFTEMSLYDPSVAAQILDLVGFESAADWFRRRPKYGLNLWNGLLEKADNPKGVMTTTPYDCRGTVYTWDEIVGAFKAEEKYRNRDSVSERRIWEKWTKDGWRPKKVPGDEAAANWWAIQYWIGEIPGLEEELKNIDENIMSSCYEFSRAFNSSDEELKENIATIIDVTDQKIQ